MTETTRKALTMWAVVVRSADADMSFALTCGKRHMALRVRKSERVIHSTAEKDGGRENTHGKLQVHEHRRRNRQDVVWIRDREIGEERDTALMELLERERAETLDAEEHAERDGELHERHQEHGEHAHAGLFVHAPLLERDALYRELVPGLGHLVELRFELEQPRLERRERRRIAQLFDGEGEQQQAREYGARDDGMEPG